MFSQNKFNALLLEFATAQLKGTVSQDPRNLISLSINQQATRNKSWINFIIVSYKSFTMDETISAQNMVKLLVCANSLFNNKD